MLNKSTWTTRTRDFPMRMGHISSGPPPLFTVCSFLSASWQRLGSRMRVEKWQSVRAPSIMAHELFENWINQIIKSFIMRQVEYSLQLVSLQLHFILLYCIAKLNHSWTKRSICAFETLWFFFHYLLLDLLLLLQSMYQAGVGNFQNDLNFTFINILVFLTLMEYLESALLTKTYCVFLMFFKDVESISFHIKHLNCTLNLIYNLILFFWHVSAALPDVPPVHQWIIGRTLGDRKHQNKIQMHNLHMHKLCTTCTTCTRNTTVFN